MGVSGFPGEFQHGLIETNLGIADGELSGVDTDGKATGAGGAVVPDQRALVSFGQFPASRQRQRTGRNDQAGGESVPQRFNISHRGFQNGSVDRGCVHRT